MKIKPSLMLLHGVTMSARVWSGVVPMLDDRFDLIVPTAAGHRGGPKIEGTASIRALTDATERILDDRGLETVHIAGNSMGGWMAIELARRGRASSVCAFSPAGLWSASEPASGTRATLAHVKKLADVTRRVTPTLLRFELARRIVFREAALHGDRMGFQEAVDAYRDLADCDVAFELFATTENLEVYSSSSCPVTVAWSANDRIFPPGQFGKIAYERLPHARFVELHDVGHVPMIDDPALCARVIRESIGENS